MGDATVAKPSAPATAERRSRRLTGRYWLVLVVALLAAGCVPGRDGPGGQSADQDQESAAAAGAQVATDGAESQLVTAFEEDEVVCDGSDRTLGEIRGALPGERILLSSNTPVTLPNVNADQTGRFTMGWNCQPNEARLRWEIRAVGHDSGRAVTFTIVGSEGAEVDAGLSVEVSDAPFVCDGFRRSIGTLGNAYPNEDVLFTSPETANLKPGRADQDGNLELNWQCQPGDGGRTWHITATGADSNRETGFKIVGADVDVESAPPLEVELMEDPFRCDGTSRPVATIKNLAPSEVVDFSSPDSQNLIDAKADGSGQIVARWQCQAADVGRVWQLTATGVQSQRSATVTITGAPAFDAGSSDGSSPDGSAPGNSVSVTVVEDPFRCDGSRHVVVTLANLAPLEPVDFSSPQSGPLRQGQADQDGFLPVHWQCGAGDIDQLWDVTATGAQSGRTAEFQIIGGAPAGG